MAPDSNPLELSRNVRKGLEELQEKLPASMSVDVFSDQGKYVEDALFEVTTTLFEALVIVALITLLFFGNPRSVLIMLISIPLSLIGTFLIMWLMGYSLNLFTMLALVIAIGLVVDDTIVVVENIHRHIEEGMAPMEAAREGAREVIGPVISMSLTLVAVFLPVSFMQGLSGKLISEFVFTLAGSVVISGIVALTLSPMLCSRVLKAEKDSSIAHWLDERFDTLRRRYADCAAHRDALPPGVGAGRDRGDRHDSGAVPVVQAGTGPAGGSGLCPCRLLDSRPPERGICHRERRQAGSGVERTAGVRQARSAWRGSSTTAPRSLRPTSSPGMNASDRRSNCAMSSSR